MQVRNLLYQKSVNLLEKELMDNEEEVDDRQRRPVLQGQYTSMYIRTSSEYWIKYVVCLGILNQFHFHTSHVAGMNNLHLSMVDEACDPNRRINCNPRSPFRTINGQCNNLANPLWGASNIAFRRLLPAKSVWNWFISFSVLHDTDLIFLDIKIAKKSLGEDFEQQMPLIDKDSILITY